MDDHCDKVDVDRHRWSTDDAPVNHAMSAWASAHRGKWGQLNPYGKMDEKLKSEDMQKEQFSVVKFSKIFFASGGKGALTP